MKVWQWKQINKAIAEGFISRMILFVSILTETPEEEIELLPSSELIKRFKTIQHLGQVHDNNKDVIDLGIELSFIPFKQLTFGQFIDLETMVSDDWEGNFCKIVASIYLHSEGGGLYETKPEPYEHINVSRRAELIEECEISDVYGAVQKYLKWRQTFFSSYELFADPFEGMDENNEEDKQVIEQEKKRLQNSGDQWMNILNTLTDNDVTKFEDVLRMNVYLVFNQLTHLKSVTKNNLSTL
jgi:hypothetical protein